MARVDMHNLNQWQVMAAKAGYHVRILSQEMRVSQRQLQRYTQTLFGRAPQHWLHELRLTMAAQMLKESRSVKAVCFQLGFKQISHFSREFKQRYGLCPTKFLIWSDRNAHGIDEDQEPEILLAPALRRAEGLKGVRQR